MCLRLNKIVILVFLSGWLSACLVPVEKTTKSPTSHPLRPLELEIEVTDTEAADAIKRLKTPRRVKTKILRLYHPDPVERAWAAYQLAKLGRGAGPAVPYLIRLLGDDTSVILSKYIGAGFHSSSDTTPGEEASRALAKIGDPAIPALIKALKAKSVAVRRLSAKALGQIGNIKSIEVLIELLADESRKVRAAAAMALGRYRHPIASQTITEAFATVSLAARVHLVYALSQINDIIAVPFLIQQLPEQGPDVRAAIVLALGKLRDARALDTLLAAANDEDEIVRANAIYAMSAFYAPAVMDTLISALSDPVERVREAASESLTQLTGMSLDSDAAHWSAWWGRQKEVMTKKEPGQNEAISK